jgi:hypothetical protein
VGRISLPVVNTEQMYHYYTPSAFVTMVRHRQLVTHTVTSSLKTLLKYIFSILPILITWREVLKYLHGTFLPQGCLHKLRLSLGRRLDWSRAQLLV